MEHEEYKKESNMNGSVGATEAATLALLTDTARAGRGGYGYGGGEGGCGGAPFAGFASNAVRLDRNSQQVEDQADCTRAVLGQAFNTIEGSFENQTRNAQFSAITKQVTDGEFRNADRLRDIEREVAANAREAAICCCEVKAEAAAVETRLTNLIKDNRIADLEARVFQASQDAQTAAIIAASSCRFPGGPSVN